MSNATKIKWIAKGSKYATDASGRLSPLDETDIPIYEKEKSFEYPDDPDLAVAGKPIDANLAIAFIQNFYEKLPKIPKNSLSGNKFVEQNYTEDDLTKFEEWVINLLIYSRAITFDKNVLLKTLSQPGCEGIRFYLCLKPNEGEPTEVLSLVTVGIDITGKDLGYEFNLDKQNDIKAGNINVQTQSYNSEYAHPPPRQGSKNSMVLGELAWGDEFENVL